MDGLICTENSVNFRRSNEMDLSEVLEKSDMLKKKKSLYHTVESVYFYPGISFFFFPDVKLSAE